MKEKIKLTEGIYDIVAPTEPALSSYDYTIIIILIVVCSAMFLYALTRFIKIKRIRAGRKIQRLKTAYHNKTTTTHDAAYQLCSLFCETLEIKTINPNHMLPEIISSHQSRWKIFANNLSRLRYQKTDAQPVDESDLFDESLFWLRIWP